MNKRSRLGVRALGLLIAGSVLLFLGYKAIYEPLKFHYLTGRLENARTSQEEKDAFELAYRWGRLLEVGRISGEHWPSNRVRPVGDHLIRVEWLESSIFTGKPYVAYCSVIDTNNLTILWRKY